MKKYFAVITKQMYRNEESYSSFLETFESSHKLTIDNVIANRCMNREEEIVLEIISTSSEERK